MKRTARASVLFLFLLLLASPAAEARNDPVGGGTTKLILSKSFATFLIENNLELSAKGGAKRKGSSFTLPVSGGSLDPTTGKGELDQQGTLAFESKGGKVPLRNIAIKTKRSPLIAKVGGSQLKVATAAAVSSRREGFGSSFQAKALRLTAKVATRLNKKLRPKVPFEEGQLIGSLVAKSQPQLITILESGRATLVFDAAFMAKLDSRFVALNPIFPAEHQGASFSFPIASGGAIAPDGTEGILRTGGAVEALQLHGGQLFWKELWLDLGVRSDSAEVDIEPTPAFPGKLGRIAVFDLGAATVSSDNGARTISISGGPLTLNAQSATSLNEAFAERQEVFRAGEAVGALSFVAQAQ
jgi:hypothetical protein